MTRLCRFNDNRLGLVEGDRVFDVTPALYVLPAVRWPVPAVDLLIAHLAPVLARAAALRADAASLAVADVRFLSPVANPPMVIAARVNYLKHQAEAIADGGHNFARDVKTIEQYGLFLKSSTSVIGTGEAVPIAFPERRTDHEIELVVVIGKGGRAIARDDALAHVAGYALGLDITVRGPEDRSLRKSLDGFSVIGPWLVTADAVPDPDALALRLDVNGAPRQRANTRDLIFDVRRLIEYASTFYTLNAGDVLFTGTPEGVGPIAPGDLMRYEIERIGAAETHVVAAG
jgi:2-keto-4-pentenoate hydratase/2-oxohepta-3-ene-1,7-dioic acid hydratase in catechol pathway